MKGQMKGISLADAGVVKMKTMEVLNNINTDEFGKSFQQWERSSVKL